MKKGKSFKKSLVVPVFNEEACIKPFVEKIEQTFPKDTSDNLEIVFVDDGSTDTTLQQLIELQKTNNKIKIIELSRNFGKEAALFAGIKQTDGNVVIPIDVDLQDPPELIHLMIREWQQGNEVVLAVRTDRKTDSLNKRIFANLFYKVQEFALEKSMPSNCGDFRLMDRVVVEALNQLSENQLFMKGLFSWVGFKTSRVEYARPERNSGTPKFNFFRLLNLGIGGIISFSIIPVRLFSILGFLVMLFSLSYAGFVLFQTLVYGVETPGFATLIIFISLLGSIQLMGIGMLGEYIGRTYFEAKRRPSFIIRKIYQN